MTDFGPVTKATLNFWTNPSWGMYLARVIGSGLKASCDVSYLLLSVSLSNKLGYPTVYHQSYNP
jgi:hypothetical protein